MLVQDSAPNPAHAHRANNTIHAQHHDHVCNRQAPLRCVSAPCAALMDRQRHTQEVSWMCGCGLRCDGMRGTAWTDDMVTGCSMGWAMGRDMAWMDGMCVDAGSAWMEG